MNTENTSQTALTKTIDNILWDRNRSPIALLFPLRDSAYKGFSTRSFLLTASFLQALLVTHKPDTIPPFISPTAYVHKLFIERSRGVTTATMDMKWNVNFRHLWGKNEENYFIYKSLELKKRKNVISVIDVSCLTHLTFSPLTSCKLISPPSLWSKPLPPSLWPKPYPICLALAIISLCNFLL